MPAPPKTVAIVAPDFPPSGTPSSLRMRKFATYLAEYGWTPVVIATDPVHCRHSADPQNVDLLPRSLEIVRTRALPISWTRVLGFTEIGLRTLPYHWQALSRLCRSRHIDVLLFSLPPGYPIVLGRLAYERFGIPYVIDYQDPWVTEYYWSLAASQRPPKWRLAHYLASALEPFALRRVSALVSVSGGVLEQLKAKYDFLEEIRSREIPFGADRNDFKYLLMHPRANSRFDPNDGCVHLSAVGACTPAMHGTLRAVLRAVRLGVEEMPSIFGRLRLHFIGTTTYDTTARGPTEVMPFIKELGLCSYVDEYGLRVPYLESLQIMLDSDALLLLGSEEPHYSASKVFPYMVANKPLLAVLNSRSNVVSMLREVGCPGLFTFGREHPPELLVDGIRKWLQELLMGTLKEDTRSDIQSIEPYSTHAMVGRLASVLDEVTALRHLE